VGCGGTEEGGFRTQEGHGTGMVEDGRKEERREDEWNVESLVSVGGEDGEGSLLQRRGGGKSEGRDAPRGRGRRSCKRKKKKKRRSWRRYWKWYV